MDDIEFINNAGFERWRDVVQLTGETEGWLLSENDFHVWKCGFGYDNFNFLVAVNTKTNQTVGSVTSAYYKSQDGSEPLMTVGMFFVAPSHRGTGLGLLLFDKIIQDDRFVGINWGLNGVPSMTEKYASKFGFNKYGDWTISVLEMDIADIDPSNLEVATDDVEILNPKNVDMDKILEYDDKILGNRVKRHGIVKSLLRADNSFNAVAVDKKGNVVGYGNVRTAFDNQLSVGPLYAENDKIASAILKTILGSIENLKEYKKIFIFPADKNLEARELAVKLSNGKINDHGVMYGQFTKDVIKTDPSKIFCVTEYAMAFA